MEADLESVLRVARAMMDALQVDIRTAVRSIPGIAEELRTRASQALEQERLIRIRDPLMLEDTGRAHRDWLPAVDRSTWYYWPRLRRHLIDRKGFSAPTVRSMDEVTDRILGAMEDPRTEGGFSVRGLVVGYVQSGKTANYSAIISKAADCGYRLFIILSGIHNSLRQQTQRRLDAELVGYSNGLALGVGPPDAAHTWHTYTAADLRRGDFNAGNVTAAALTETHPILMVVKKNASILTRLTDWLNTIDEGIRREVPVMVIDDEADQASPNTGGNRPPLDTSVDLEPDEDDAPPTRINELIRTLLTRFSRVSYLAYTATPFANVLIDHRAVDRVAGQDLYPQDFIVALPQPLGYSGAGRIFGAADEDGGVSELDIIRIVPDDDVPLVVPIDRASVPTFEPRIPESLRDAFDDFVLAGAARSQRGQGDRPATMLIHTSYRTSVQRRLTELVAETVGDLRDQWRYARRDEIEARLRRRWDDFRRVTRSVDQALDRPFEEIQPQINTFLQQVEVRELNVGSDDELDYDRDPDLKVVVVGGNRLSRGLTLEGLLVSYYVRPAFQYDTLMQMGRWFGFREGYLDLTRIHTTRQLARWFRDLATVEAELREEIERYGVEGLTPLQMGVRIRQHPSLLVTSPLKMGSAEEISVSFAGAFVQTVTFPFEDIDWLSRNLETTRGFLQTLGQPTENPASSRPLWRGVPAHLILEFLGAYQTDRGATRVNVRLMRDFIRAQLEHDELREWVVAVMGPTNETGTSEIDLGIEGGRPVRCIERTRLRNAPNSLKAIASPGDQGVGLSEELEAQARATGGVLGRELLRVRDPREGVLLIYPISRYSGHRRPLREGRTPIFADPEHGMDVIGIALGFPDSESAATVEYLVGSVGTGP